MATIREDQAVSMNAPNKQPDRYPKEIKLLASDGALGDDFGISVAISGDTLVVGAHGSGGNGAAYVFKRNQDGVDNWGQTKKLTASDGSSDDRFGNAVAISGDTIVVGAEWDDDNGTQSGSAYVFERNKDGADNWGQVQKLTASDGASTDLFGTSVAISGDTIVIGSFYDDDDGTDSGSAYIYSRNQSGADSWGQVKKLTASDGAGGDRFGNSVSISGDTVVVGAYWDDENGGNSGSAYVFERNHDGADNWGQVQKLTASDGAGSDYFGDSVAISSDTVIVGACLDDDNGNNSGSAYVFERNQDGADNWGQVQKLIASDGTTDDQFGCAVSISGDTIVVGAWRDENFTGSAYIFTRNKDGVDWWGQVKKLSASDGAANDDFGYSVAVSDGTVVVGVKGDDDLGYNSGTAYLYPAENLDFYEIRKLKAPDASTFDSFGASVGISGDTLVVGAVDGDGNVIDSGAAYVFARNSDGSGGKSADTWDYVKKLYAADGATDNFGTSVAISGDMLVVGANKKNSFKGAAYVFERNQGGADNWGQVQILTASDGASGDRLGESVGISGDTIVVGARGESDEGNDAGAAYIFERNQGGSDNWGQVQKLIASDGAEDDWFGVSVAISGDTIIVGAQGNDSNKGAAYIFNRNQSAADYWGQVKKITSLIRVSDYRFGGNVSISGDTLVVSAHGENNYRGSAYVFERNEGGADNWGQVEKIFPSDGEADDFFGSVSISGDSIVVGAHADDDNGTQSGSVYVYARNQGGADEWGFVQKLTASDGTSQDDFGWNVEINGNAIVVGAEGDYETGVYDGSAYVFTTFQPQKVWFDEAHNSWNTIDWERALVISDTWVWPEPEWIYFGKLKTTLAPAYELISQTVSISHDALREYDAVILPPHDGALSQAEIDALNYFIADGGGLILMGDCGFWDPNSSFTAQFSLAFDPYCLFAPVPNQIGDIEIVSYQYLAPVSGITSFWTNWGQTVTDSWPAFWIADTWDTNAWVDNSEPWDTYNSGEEGAFNVISGYDMGCGRVAAVADNSFQDHSFEDRRNDRLMRALLTWVTGGQSCLENVFIPLVLK